MEENKILLVSVKSKKSPAQSQGQVYVVSKKDIFSFVKKHLDDDTILFIDSVETFVSGSLSIDETLSTDKTL